MKCLSYKYMKQLIMETSELLKKVECIFRDILDNDEIELSESTVADDIDEWDSLTHIQLVVAIEKEFGIKFTSREILSWNNVGDMIKTIRNKS